MLVSLKSNTLSDYYLHGYSRSINNINSAQNTSIVQSKVINKKNTNKSKGTKLNKISGFIDKYYALIAVILTVTILSIVLFSTIAYGSAPVQYDDVIVEQGDCLWNIASRYCRGNMDIRTFIAEIIEVNAIDGDYIYPGMVLKIPVK